MNTTEEKSACVARSWRLAVYAGIAVAVLFMLFGGSGLFQAVIAGAVIAGILGFALTRLMCPDAATSSDQTGEAPSAAANTEAPETAPVAAKEPAPEPVAASEPVAEPDAPSASASPLVKPSKVLPGQQDLASRKGTWRFDKDNASA